jgi:hypothetical protein
MNTSMRRQYRLHPRAGLLVLIAVALACSTCVSAPAARADLSFCSSGPGAGQCSDPEGLASDSETGRVYVADRENHRVDVFESNGTFLLAFGWGVANGAAKLETCTTASGCQRGLVGSGAGQFSEPIAIAVDNVPGSASRHDVYVGADNFRVQKFSPAGEFLLTISSYGTGECQIDKDNDQIVIGPGGDLFVADRAKVGASVSEGFVSRVEKFSAAGSCLGETKLFGPTAQHPVRKVADLAVDASENAYITVEGGGVQELGPRMFHLGTPEAEVCNLDPGIETGPVALNAAGDLFAGERENAGFPNITEYNGCPPNNIVRRFGYGRFAPSLAVFHSAEGDVFADEQGFGAIRYVSFPSPGPIVVPESVQASPVRSVWAGIKARVNPEGKATDYRVQYVDRHSYETEGGFASSNTRSSGEVPLGAEGFSVHAAEAIAGCHPFTEQALGEGTCLVPRTDYRYRIVAKNADGESSAEGEFTTSPPLEFESVYASEAATDAIALNGVVNPFGGPVTGYFQYIDDAGYRAGIAAAEAEGKSRVEAEAEGRGFDHALASPGIDVGQSPLDFGSGEEGVRRSAVLSALPAGTTFHYRLVLSDPFGTLVSEQRTFTTFGKQSSEPGGCSEDEAFRTGPSALLPDCRVYEMVSPIDKQGGDIAVMVEQGGAPAVLEQSAVSGGRLAYGSYRAFGDAKSASYTSQYIAARGSEGWVSHTITPPEEKSISGHLTYENDYHALSPDLCQGWLVPLAEPPLAEGAIVGFKNLYRRTDQLCGEGGNESYEALSTERPESFPPVGGLEIYGVELQGVSSDGSVVAFMANDSLEGSGAPAQSGCTAPNFFGCHRRLYVRATGGQPRFVCVLPDGVASKESCSAGRGPSSYFPNTRLASVTGALSSDGSRLFWTNSEESGRIYLRENPLGEGSECTGGGSPCTIPVSQAAEEEVKSASSQFWAGAEDGSRAIFTTGGGLYEFVVAGEVTHRIAGGVLGVAGESRDASRVYFVSTEMIAGAGNNSEGDVPVADKPNLYLHEIRAGGGGDYRFIATLASADVSDDDSLISLAPQQRNARVSADGSQIAFVSNASVTGYGNTDAVSGEADSEVFVYDATANEGSGQIVCASCNPTGARPSGANVGSGHPFWMAARLPGWEMTLYAPRVFSDGGDRLFFESQDALVARDTNRHIDVYEWERVGTGGCTVTDVTFSAAAHGCIDLISSGLSDNDSRFVDASPSGEDVFFATLSSLVPQDPGSLDIYDAREPAPGHPAGFPPMAAPPAVCEGEACQSPPVAPLDATPASFAFTGAGDPLVSPVVTAVKPKARTLTRAQQLANALRACRSTPKRKRAACRTRARKRYATRAKRPAGRNAGTKERSGR